MNTSFGDKIRVCRKVFNLTQEQLAERLSTTKQVVSRYESGLRIPKITIAQDYANALRVPVSLLIDPSVSFDIWEHYDLIEDYDSGNDDVRRNLVQQFGVDPRIASSYAELFLQEKEKPSADYSEGLTASGFSSLSEENKKKAKDYIEMLLKLQRSE